MGARCTAGLAGALRDALQAGMSNAPPPALARPAFLTARWRPSAWRGRIVRFRAIPAGARGRGSGRAALGALARAEIHAGGRSRQPRRAGRRGAQRQRAGGTHRQACARRQPRAGRGHHCGCRGPAAWACQRRCIVSLLALHGVNDLPGALAQIRRALTPDGLFMACLLGGATLSELRQSLWPPRRR